MNARRDITGIARDLGVNVEDVIHAVKNISLERGETDVIAEHEPVLNNHELTEEGYTLICDRLQNSSEALVNDLGLLTRLAREYGLRRDTVTLTFRSYQIDISFGARPVADILFALDLLADVRVQVAKWDRGVHVEIAGRVERRTVEVSTTVEGDDAKALVAAIAWPDTEYPRVTPTADEFRKLAEAVSS